MAWSGHRWLERGVDAGRPVNCNYPYLFLHRAPGEPLRDDVRLALDTYSFMQYYVTFDEGSMDKYYCELIKIVLSAGIDKACFGEDRIEATKQHLSKELRAVVEKQCGADKKGGSGGKEMDGRLIYPGLYIYNRLLYSSELSVRLSETKKCDGVRIDNEGVPAEDGNGKSTTLYFKGTVLWAYGTGRRRIDLTKYSNSDRILARSAFLFFNEIVRYLKS